MTKQSLVPEGISHDFDLSKLSYPERMKHHTKQLNTLAVFDGLNAVREYQAKHPETADFRMQGRQVVYAPKPKGYVAAISGMVDLWFDSAIALAQTNRTDVTRLNSKLSGTFDPDRFFSKQLTPSVRKRIEGVFQKRGTTLPETVRNMTGVRQAVKAFKAGTAPEAQPFANIGKRVGNMLGIGTRTFAIFDYKGRECIRLSTGDKRERVSVAAIQELLSGLQTLETPGEQPTGYINIYTRELASSGVSAHESPVARTPEASSPGDVEAAAAVDEPAPSLYDRIARLAAANRAAQIIPTDDGPDPLELQS